MYALIVLSILIISATASFIYSAVSAITPSQVYSSYESDGTYYSSSFYSGAGIAYSLYAAVFHSAIFAAIFKRDLKWTKVLVMIKTVFFVIACVVFAGVCFLATAYGHFVIVAWILFLIWFVIEGGLVTIPLWLHRKKLIMADEAPIAPGYSKTQV
jgi:hypothetical protein